MSPVSETTRPRRRRLLATAGACAVIAALALAACGSGGTHTTAGRQAPTPARVLRFTECVRSHGVPNVPDPGAGRGWKNALASTAPAVVSAERTCSRLVPGVMRSSSSSSPSRRQLAAEVAFARCMRSHGFQRFPDPSTSGGITHAMVDSAGIDVHQPAVLRAADACVGVTHGLITKRTVADFAAGH